eukprot:6941336-Prymnesium_polylepis.1
MQMLEDKTLKFRGHTSQIINQLKQPVRGAAARHALARQRRQPHAFALSTQCVGPTSESHTATPRTQVPWPYFHTLNLILFVTLVTSAPPPHTCVAPTACDTLVYTRLCWRSSLLSSSARGHERVRVAHSLSL